MRRTIRLNEADLHKIIKESVKKVLNENEIYDYPYMDKGTGAWMFNVNDEDYDNIQVIMKKLLDARNSVNSSTTFQAYDGVDPNKYADLLIKQIDQAIRTCRKYVEARRMANNG